MSWNKGIKRATSAKCAATYFKKGNVFKKHVPTGLCTVRTNSKGCKRVVINVNSRGERHHDYSYARYVVEKKLGRVLEKTEKVYHVDKDPLNNKISNLIVIKTNK